MKIKCAAHGCLEPIIGEEIGVGMVCQLHATADVVLIDTSWFAFKDEFEQRMLEVVRSVDRLR